MISAIHNEDYTEPDHNNSGLQFSIRMEPDPVNTKTDPEIELAYLVRPATNQTEALEAFKSISGKPIINEETGIKGEINRKQRDKRVSGAALQKSKMNGFSYADHFHAIANIDRLYRNASLVSDADDKDDDPNVLSIKRFVAPVVINDIYAEAYITIGQKIYSFELDEIKKPSDLKGGTLNERYHIPEGYNNLLSKIRTSVRRWCLSTGH